MDFFESLKIEAIPHTRLKTLGITFTILYNKQRISELGPMIWKLNSYWPMKRAPREYSKQSKIWNAYKRCLSLVRQRVVLQSMNCCRTMGKVSHHLLSVSLWYWMHGFWIDCPERLEIDVDSLAWLMYSSGTTGIPKGIVHTHRTMTAYIHNHSLVK